MSVLFLHHYLLAAHSLFRGQLTSAYFLSRPECPPSGLPSGWISLTNAVAQVWASRCGQRKETRNNSSGRSELNELSSLWEHLRGHKILSSSPLIPQLRVSVRLLKNERLEESWRPKSRWGSWDYYHAARKWRRRGPFDISFRFFSLSAPQKDIPFIVFHRPCLWRGIIFICRGYHQQKCLILTPLNIMQIITLLLHFRVRNKTIIGGGHCSERVLSIDCIQFVERI